MFRKITLALIVTAIIVLSLVIPAEVVAQSTKTIRFGLYNNPPLSFLDEDGNPQGLIIDIINAIAKDEGWKITYIPCEFSVCLEMADEGEIDLLAPIAYSEDRAKKFDFTNEATIINWGQVYMRDDSSIETIFDLNGKTLAVLRNDIHTQAIEKLLSNFYVSVSFVYEDDYQTVFEELRDGQVDAGVVNRLYGSFYGSTYNLKGSPIIFNPIDIVFAAKKGAHQEELTTIDHSLQKYKQNQDSIYYQSIDHWLAGKAVWHLPEWAPWLGGLIGLALVSFGIANIVLRREVHRKTKQLQEEISEKEIAQGKLQEYTEHLEELVTERTRELWEALNQIVRQEKLAVLGQVVTGIGVELGTPLTTISNAAYYLEMNMKGEREKEYTGIIKSEVQKTEEILNNFLIYTNPKPPLIQKVPVEKLVKKVMDEQLPNEDVKISIEIPDSTPSLVVDPTHIERVLKSLVSNAIEAMPEGGMLTIRAEENKSRAGRVLLYVGDTGTGITPENSEHIFEPLFTTKEKSVGLGLAICKQLVEANDGVITFESELGKGSTFALDLPGYSGQDAGKEGGF